MKTLTIATMVALAGCGSSGDECEPPNGPIVLQWTERAGDCTGDFEGVFAFDGTVTDELPEGCTGLRTVDRDACVVRLDTSCRIYSEVSGWSTTTFEGDIGYDARSVTGLLDVRFSDSSGICSATYEVEGER